MEKCKACSFPPPHLKQLQDFQPHAYSPNAQHTRNLYTGLFLCLQMCRKFETVTWNRFHLLCVLDQTKEAPSHAQMLLQEPAFQSLQNLAGLNVLTFLFLYSF